MKEMLASFFQLDIAQITPAFLIAQAIGPVTTVMSIVSAQFKKLTPILLSELMMNALVALSYILLGGLSGSYICIAASVQTLVCYFFARREVKVPRALTAAFVAMYIVITIITWQGPLDILPGVCAVMFALSVVQDNPAGYRIYMGVNSLLWIIYDIVILAYSMVITHGLLLISIIIAILRHDIQKKKAL